MAIGLFRIGIEFFVKSVPEMIAGYNTMPKDKKKNVDIEGLSAFIRNCLVCIGLSIVVGYYLLKWIGFSNLANFIMPVAMFVGIIVLYVKAQKFNHNKDLKTGI